MTFCMRALRKSFIRYFAYRSAYCLVWLPQCEKALGHLFYFEIIVSLVFSTKSQSNPPTTNLLAIVTSLYIHYNA
jgi:hypothetical protein